MDLRAWDRPRKFDALVFLLPLTARLGCNMGIRQMATRPDDYFFYRKCGILSWSLFGVHYLQQGRAPFGINFLDVSFEGRPHDPKTNSFQILIKLSFYILWFGFVIQTVKNVLACMPIVVSVSLRAEGVRNVNQGRRAYRYQINAPRPE